MDLFPSKWLTWIFSGLFIFYFATEVPKAQSVPITFLPLLGYYSYNVHAAYYLTDCLWFSESPVSFLQRQEAILTSEPEQSASKPSLSLSECGESMCPPPHACSSHDRHLHLNHTRVFQLNIFKGTVEGQGAAMLKDFYMTMWPSTSNKLLPPLSFLRPCITILGCSPPDEVLRAA